MSTQEINVVFIGEPRSGKSTLSSRVSALNDEILYAVDESGDAYPPHIPLPPVSLSPIEITFDDNNVDTVLSNAKSICVVFDMNKPDAFSVIELKFVPLMVRLQLAVPTAVVGMKADVSGTASKQAQYRQSFFGLSDKHTFLESLHFCSSVDRGLILAVRKGIILASLFAARPVYDRISSQLTPTARDAFTRIFSLLDRDRDEELSEDELEMYERTFETTVNPAQRQLMLSRLEHLFVSSVSSRGRLTRRGLICLQELLTKTGRSDVVWRTLNRYGYQLSSSGEIEMNSELYIPEAYRTLAPGASVELSQHAFTFLVDLFNERVRSTGRSYLTPPQLDALFASAPGGSLFPSASNRLGVSDDSSRDAVGLWNAVKTVNGFGVDLSAFLSMWSLLVSVNYKRALSYLAYMGFDMKSTPPLKMFTLQRRRFRTVIRCSVISADETISLQVLSSFLGQSAELAVVGGSTRACRMLAPPGSDKIILFTLIPVVQLQTWIEGSLPGHLDTVSDVILGVFDSTLPDSFDCIYSAAHKLGSSPAEIPFIVAAAHAEKVPSVQIAQARSLLQRIGLRGPEKVLAVEFPDTLFNKIGYAASLTVASGDEDSDAKGFFVMTERKLRLQRLKKTAVRIAAAAIGAGLAIVVLSAGRSIMRSWRTRHLYSY